MSHALLALGKDILLIFVFNHICLSVVLIKLIITIFLSIVLFNLSRDLTYLSRGNSLLR